MNNEKLIQQLFDKGGNDGHLMLLDLLMEVKDRLDSLEEEYSNNPKAQVVRATRDENARSERLVMKLAMKLAEMEKGDKGDPGETPTPEQLISLMLPLIPDPIPGKDGPPGPPGAPGGPGKEGRPGKDGSPDTPDDIRKKLESLKGEKRLSVEAIKGLKEFVEKNGTKTVIGYGGQGGMVVMPYDLSASLDGVTKTFTLPAFWRILSVGFSSAPWFARPTVDFTADAANSQITFTSQIDASTVLASGQTVTILYAQP